MSIYYHTSLISDRVWLCMTTYGHIWSYMIIPYHTWAYNMIWSARAAEITSLSIIPYITHHPPPTTCHPYVSDMILWVVTCPHMVPYGCVCCGMMLSMIYYDGEWWGMLFGALQRVTSNIVTFPPSGQTTSVEVYIDPVISFPVAKRGTFSRNQQLSASGARHNFSGFFSLRLRRVRPKNLQNYAFPSIQFFFLPYIYIYIYIYIKKQKNQTIDN